MHTPSLLPADNLISCFNESANECVKVLDTDARLLSFNTSGYDIMEIDNPKDVLGKNWLSFWEGEFGEKAQEAFDKAKKGNLGYFEGFCPTLKGTPKWWQVTVVPLKNNHDEIEWIISMSRDITELHHLREENKSLKLQLQHS